MNKSSNLAFIGAGHLAKSIISGLLKSNYPNYKIYAVRRRQEKLKDLMDLGVRCSSECSVAITQAQIVFICVPPSEIYPLLKLAHPWDLTNKTIVSVVAGTKLADLEKFLPQTAVIRAMPNLATQVQLSMTGLYANKYLSAEVKKDIEDIFCTIGQIIWVDKEQKIDVITAVAGSGPAYFYYLMSAMIDFAHSNGLSHEDASLLVKQTALGATKLGSDPQTLISELLDKVQVPQGTTSAAINYLQQNKIKENLIAAMQQAKLRAEEISNQSPN